MANYTNGRMLETWKLCKPCSVPSIPLVIPSAISCFCIALPCPDIFLHVPALHFPHLRERSGEFCVYTWVAPNLSWPKICNECRNLSQPVTAFSILTPHTQLLVEQMATNYSIIPAKRKKPWKQNNRPLSLPSFR